MQPKILILDIETTGLYPSNAYIVEIGIVELNLETGEKQILFDSVIREKGMPTEYDYLEESWIVSNGYMTSEEIRNGKPLSEVKAQIQDILDSYPLGATAYNNPFDFGFLEDRGFEFYRKLPCPMKLSSDICQVQWNDHYQSWKWPKVQEAYDFFFPNNNYTELHRGADDAYHEADIVLELYKRGAFGL